MILEIQKAICGMYYLFFQYFECNKVLFMISKKILKIIMLIDFLNIYKILTSNIIFALFLNIFRMMKQRFNFD